MRQHDEKELFTSSGLPRMFTTPDDPKAEISQFRKIFTNAIRRLCTVDEVEAMVKNMIRIAKNSSAHPAQVLASIQLLMERIEGPAPKNENVASDTTKVIVLPSVGQNTLSIKPPSDPIFVEEELE